MIQVSREYDDEEVQFYIREKRNNSEEVPGWSVGEDIFNAAQRNGESVARQLVKLMMLIEDEVVTDAELGFQNTTSAYEEHGTHLFCGFIYENVDDIRFAYGTARRLAQNGVFIGGFDGKTEELCFDHKDFMPDTDALQTELSMFGEVEFRHRQE